MANLTVPFTISYRAAGIMPTGVSACAATMTSGAFVVSAAELLVDVQHPSGSEYGKLNFAVNDTGDAPGESDWKANPWEATYNGVGDGVFNLFVFVKTLPSGANDFVIAQVTAVTS